MPRSGNDGDAAHVAKHELIGLRAEVVASSHPPLVGLSGRIVDETRNTLVVETATGERVVPKAGQRFALTLSQGSTVELEGRRLAFRPEDRIKKSR